MKAVRTDSELECPGIDAGLLARGVELMTLPDGIPETELCMAVDDADLLLMCYTPITARVIAAAPKLKGIIKYGVGIDAIDIPAAIKRGIPVVNVPEYAEETVAEGAFALMTALAKRLPEIGRTMDRDGWVWPEQRWLGRDISGATVGLVGCGKIGRSMARMAGQGFRAKVLGYDPNADPAALAPLGIEKVDDLKAMLAACDFVSIHCVLNEKTRGLIGRAELACLKPSAVLVNVSRGALIDETALVETVVTGRIGGVGLDVYSQEPLKKYGHPMSALFGRDNVILFPHLTFFTVEAIRRLEDDTLAMFIKLMGRLFSQANNRKKQRQLDCRPDTAKALRMFLDTITALQSANDYGRNALEVLDQRVGWHRLLRMKPELESMVENNEASPLVLAGEQYATVSKYAGAFLRAFMFQSARRHDPLLASIALLKRLYAEKRRTLPDRVPITHLSQADRRLVFEQGKPDRRLYEIATLAALRDRLRSADIWVDGSRSFRPIDEHLMPRSTFTAMKEEDRLGLGVQGDGAQWLAEARQILDFNLKRLAHRARSGKLEGVRLEAGTLIVTPTAGEVPAAVEDLNAEISDMYPLVEVPDLLREVHEWTGFADHFTHVRTGDVPRNISAMLAGVLADATNLGPKRMASASKGIRAAMAISSRCWCR
jgi:phosphoglycerate dehydrogenase-like enzyme